MTNNFQRILGKGGFGIVYYGSVNGTEQVAVKMLTHSSAQGYKQFKAEVHIPLPLMKHTFFNYLLHVHFFSNDDDLVYHVLR